MLLAIFLLEDGHELILFSFTVVYIVGNKLKGWISKRVFQENKARQISQKRTFLTPWYAYYVCILVGKKSSFFGKFDEFCFLEKPLLRFALLPYYRRYVMFLEVNFKNNLMVIKNCENLCTGDLERGSYPQTCFPFNALL